MLASGKPMLLRLGGAVTSVVLAIVARRLLDPCLGGQFPFATLFLAIMLMAWLGGLVPALTAVVVGGLAADYFLLAPRGSFNLDPTALLGLLLYLLTGCGIAGLGGLMHRAQRRAETSAAALRASNAQLEARVQERTAELLEKTQILEAEVSARRRGEARLKLLETCLNRLNDIVLITEAEPQEAPGPRILYVNDAFVRRTGYSRAEALGQTPRLLHGPKTDRRQLDRIRAALRQWQPIRVELVNYTKSGEELWLDLDIVPVADEQGWFTHFVAVERDISDRKMAEEKAARLAAIVESSDDAIVGKNLAGIVTSWNAGAEKIFGYQAAEMVGQPILRIIPPDRQHEEAAILSQIRRGESVRHFDTVRQHKNGGTQQVSLTVSPIKDATGQIIGVSKIARNINERILAASTLLENEARLQLALQAGGMGTFEINLGTGEAHWNSVEYELLGLQPGVDAPGPETFFRYVHPEDVTGLRTAWAEALRTGALAAEFRVRLPDGRVRWLVGRGRFAFPEANPARPPSRFLGVNFDITERKRAEAALQEREGQLRLYAEYSPAAIAMLDRDMKYMVVSHRWLADHQLVGQSIIGRSHYDCLPDLPASWTEIHQRCLAGAVEKSDEDIHLRADGTREYKRWEIRPWYQADGAIGGIIIFAEDITARKTAEEALRAGEERRRLLVETMLQGVVHQAADGTIVALNPAAERILGKTREQLVGSSSGHEGQDTIHEDGSPFPGPEHPAMVALRTSRKVRGVIMGIWNTPAQCRRWISIDAVPVLPPGEVRPVEVYTIFEDITERKQVELALALERQKLSAALENTDIGFVLFNPRGGEMTMNQAALRFHGFASVGDMLTRIEDYAAAWELHYADGRPMPYAEWPVSRAVAGDYVQNYEAHLHNLQTHHAWVGSYTAKPVRNRAGEVSLILLTILDITERKRAEAERLKSEHLLQAVMDLVPHFIFAKDGQSRHLFVNRACAAANGLTPAQMIGRTDRDLLPNPAEAEACMRVDREVLASGKLKFVAEEHLTIGTGETRIFQTTKIPFSLPGLDGPALVGVAVDITALKRGAAALRESQERLAALMANLGEGLVMGDPQGRVIYGNPAALVMFGCANLDELQRHLSGLAAPFEIRPLNDDEPLAVDDWAMKRVLRGEVLRDWAVRVRRRDQGWEKILAHSGWLIHGSGGETLAFVSTTDITLRQQAAEKIRQLNAELERRVAARTTQLEAANKELEAFSYSVSHDLRAPLRAVNGFAGLVLAEFGERLPPAGQHYLERIQKGGVRMGLLIDDLLAFSRLNRQSINWQTVAMSSLVPAAWEELEAQRQGRALDLHVGDLPPCRGDWGLLKQVWINLLSNAVKYTQGRTPATIAIGCRSENDEAVYFVRDNGAGFSMQYADKLFGVFQRLHRAEEFAGTGVGLAIVQRIIHRHGGRIWAEAEVDRGATFYFTLKPNQPL